LTVWLLVGILVQGSQVFTKPLGAFVEMDRCFEVREYVLAQASKPKLNYEVVCVQTNEMGGL